MENEQETSESPEEYEEIQTLDELADQLADRCLEGDFKKAAQLFYHVFAKRGHELRDEEADHDDEHEPNCEHANFREIIESSPGYIYSPNGYADFYNLIVDFPNMKINKIY